MSKPENEEKKVAQMKSKKPMLIGLILACVGGGGGFYATSSGLILASESHSRTQGTDAHQSDTTDIAFVPFDPMIVSLRAGAQARHLRFRAQLEVPLKYENDVTKLLPRVVDVLNGYLGALDVKDLEDSSALIRLRAQMLRRVQIVTGNAKVNDLLIMEFVLN